MGRVEDFEWRLGDWGVRWRAGDVLIERSYPGEIGSAVVLRDGSGVAIVETVGRHEPRNAVVVNADGSERFRVSPPTPSRHVTFQQMYYVGDELTAIAHTTGNDWAIVVDSGSGHEVRSYETR